MNIRPTAELAQEISQRVKGMQVDAVAINPRKALLVLAQDFLGDYHIDYDHQKEKYVVLRVSYTDYDYVTPTYLGTVDLEDIANSVSGELTIDSFCEEFQRIEGLDL